MAFAWPDGLAPEVYPLAWLVGCWRGDGVLSYPGLAPAALVNEVVVDHDGGPYLRYTSTVRLLDGDPPTVAQDGTWPRLSAAEVAAAVESASVWSTETGYWRISPERPADLAEDLHPVEVLLADPAGRVSVYVGAAGRGRITIASDVMARTQSAADVSASQRLFGLVDGDLLWAWELAAFGHPLQSYASARLMRWDEGDG